jgi:ribosome-binding ATPase YchF (GTP1/OBG family)
MLLKMDRFLLKTKAALNDCKEHLQNTDSLNSAIENYLTQYISIVFCAEMEESIKRLFNEAVEQRASPLTDLELQEFISNQLKKLKQSGLKKSDLADYLKNFSEQAKERFNNQLQDKDREITAYNNMILNRHSVAHTSTVRQFSFRDLESAVQAAKEILSAIQIALQPD